MINPPNENYYRFIPLQYFLTRCIFTVMIELNVNYYKTNFD